MIPLPDIEAARIAIAPHVVSTPVDESRSIAAELGVPATLKLEMFQRTGSFKPRGAINQVLSLPRDRLEVGVVGMSGGNFAQGLAFAASALGLRATIIMPEGTPTNYVDATRGYGADVEFAPNVAAAFDRADAYGAEGWAVAHPFDHPAMQAGNGTLGLEIVEQIPDFTDLFVSVGGGGLISGVASAVLGLKPDVHLWAVETEGADALAKAVAAGRRVDIEPTSIAKTLCSPYAAQSAIDLAHDHLRDVIVVSDVEAIDAMSFVFERAKVVAEPAAACTLAAARKVRDQLTGRTVLLMCGGNVSAHDFAKWVRPNG